jgi:hypothetical protein
MQRLTVDENVLENAKIELIEKLKTNINLDSLKEICKENHGIKMISGIDCTSGDIVSHNGAIAYQLDYDIRFSMKLLIDSAGNCIDIAMEKQDEPESLEDRIDEAGYQAASESHRYR